MVPHITHKLRGFEELEEPAEQWLAEVASRNLRDVRPKVDLLRQGDCTGPMHILIEGWAIRYKTLEDGRRQILSVLLPGDLFDINGFMASSMDHSIAALTGVTLARLDNDFLDTARREHAALEKALWCDIHVTAAIQREWSTSLGQRTARERMAHLLCELYIRQRQVELADGGRCPFPLTQIELAEALGMTPVYVNRTLQDLRREGLVQLEHKMLTIFDLAQLKRVALFDSGYLKICDDDGGASAEKESDYAF
ncbi:Crp/Fnr family transcriptional regulator [Blastomonas sp.]|uniref:Crp/Fnr family transcriptional regulator n=1 Tax=Blastomonas sp. TaxID=1909299 RepID=UPI0026265D2B|nr:Crp/Fnr family transcriptional regulator [Blastomonas sp.]MDM7956078.1 Crp/Fnr family transcriptional regulator [Blastomonas sp.]